MQCYVDNAIKKFEGRVDEEKVQTREAFQQVLGFIDSKAQKGDLKYFDNRV